MKMEIEGSSLPAGAGNQTRPVTERIQPQCGASPAGLCTAANTRFQAHD